MSGNFPNKTISDIFGGGLDALGLNRVLQNRAKPPPGPSEPNPAQARLDALAGQADMLKKKRASQTLFTGGQGVLETAPSASNTLLGL